MKKLKQYIIDSGQGMGVKGITRSFINQIKIPLPPLSVQQEIVAEIEGYQKVIDGARQVVENYKPRIAVDESWPMVELGEVCTFVSGGTPSKAKPEYWAGDIPWISPKDMKIDYIFDSTDKISESAITNSSTVLLPANSLLCVVRSGILVHTFPVAINSVPVSMNQDIYGLIPDASLAKARYLLYLLKSLNSLILATGIKKGPTVHSLHSGFLKKLAIPLPPLEIQQQIVAAIEEERQLVDANKKLIGLFENKIKAKIGEVWGTE